QSISDKEGRIQQCKDEKEKQELMQRELKTDLDDAHARIKDRQNKMMQVQTSREHQALLKEIEENKRLIKAHEEKLLQVMEQIEQLEKDAAELENLCTGEKKLLIEESEDVVKAIEKINARKKAVLNKRETLAPELRPGTLQRYDMLREKRNGTAVVQTRNGVCQGCFMTIPPQQDNEVRKGEKLNFCPTCQRILYYLEEEPESLDA
ncbi:MAG: zinc ribbon domain-containing protein, partial [Desulfobulbales bacterium]